MPAEVDALPVAPEIEWPILRGLAVDKLSGAPAVGVTVSSGDYWDGGIEVVTNERGEFDVEEHSQLLILRGGGYAYTVVSPHDDRERLRWSGGRVVVPLARSARAHGRITNQAGGPVTTGYVVAVSRSHEMYWSTRETDWAALPGVGATYRHSCGYNTAAWIGPDGTYVLDDLPAGEEFHIVVESVDELPEPFGPYSLEPGVDAEIDITTHKSSRIKGKLVCAPMGSFERVSVTFRPERFYERMDGARQRDGGVVGFAFPLEDGSFESPALYPYERMSVSVSGNYFPWPGSQPFKIQKGASVELPPESVVEVEIELWL